MPTPFVWYDVFTDHPFSGNPLAVFPQAGGLDDHAMAWIARELNLSETTFVSAPETRGTHHRVRIFTPGRELDFAGHPTLGTAIALADGAGVDRAELVLGLNAGATPVRVERRPDGVYRGQFVAPRLPELSPCPATPAELAASVGLDPDALEPAWPAHLADAGGTAFAVAVVTSLDALAAARSPVDPLPGVVGTYLATPTTDGWQVRMFAPAVGVPEDPATGSAACAFAGSLHRFGGLGDGTHDIAIRQGVEMGRPSDLQLSFDVRGAEVTEVRLGGAAVRVMAGTVD